MASLSCLSCNALASTGAPYDSHDAARNDKSVPDGQKQNEYWNEDASCAICLEPLSASGQYDDSTAVEALIETCNHIFHTACLKNHLNQDKTACPLCRIEIDVSVINRLRTVQKPYSFPLPIYGPDVMSLEPPSGWTYVSIADAFLDAFQFMLEQDHTLDFTVDTRAEINNMMMRVYKTPYGSPGFQASLPTSNSEIGSETSDFYTFPTRLIPALEALPPSDRYHIPTRVTEDDEYELMGDEARLKIIQAYMQSYFSPYAYEGVYDNQPRLRGIEINNGNWQCASARQWAEVRFRWDEIRYPPAPTPPEEPFGWIDKATAKAFLAAFEHMVRLDPRIPDEYQKDGIVERMKLMYYDPHGNPTCAESLPEDDGEVLRVDFAPSIQRANAYAGTMRTFPARFFSQSGTDARGRRYRRMVTTYREDVERMLAYFTGGPTGNKFGTEDFRFIVNDGSLRTATAEQWEEVLEYAPNVALLAI